MAHLHLGPILLLPPKNALGQAPHHSQESLTPTPTATLTLHSRQANPLLGGEGGTEGGGEVAHLRLSDPQALPEVIPRPPQTLHLHLQLCRLHLSLLLRLRLVRLLQLPPRRLQLLPPLVGHVEGIVQGTLSVALDLLCPRQGPLALRALPLDNAASTPVTAACSTKVLQVSVTCVTTVAKAPTSRAAAGGAGACTLATFEGLREGVGALPRGGRG